MGAKGVQTRSVYCGKLTLENGGGDDGSGSGSESGSGEVGGSPSPSTIQILDATDCSDEKR